MASLAALISASVVGDGAGLVERAVFDSTNGTVIASALEHVVVDILGTQVEEPIFYETSVGCVVGLRMHDGSNVVVKAYQQRWTDGFLRAVHRAQATLAAAGFPCPRPIAGPVSVLAGRAQIESYLPDPGLRPVTAEMLSVSATGLATQIKLCGGLNGSRLRPHPMDADTDDLYPVPHSPIFDFEATAVGAEWIDELAQAAKAVRDRRTLASVIAHCDWSARNVRMCDTGLLAVYDWDSLSTVGEAIAVGQAAATWSAFDGSAAAPSAIEIATYVARYEEVRGMSFDIDERRVAGAAALYVLAYTARCEHAIDPELTVHRRARPRLAVEGDTLLELPRLMVR